MPEPEKSGEARSSWRAECPECPGKGFVWLEQSGGIVAWAARCDFCRGTGLVDVD